MTAVDSTASDAPSVDPLVHPHHRLIGAAHRSSPGPDRRRGVGAVRGALRVWALDTPAGSAAGGARRRSTAEPTSIRERLSAVRYGFEPPSHISQVLLPRSDGKVPTTLSPGQRRRPRRRVLSVWSVEYCRYDKRCARTRPPSRLTASTHTVQFASWLGFCTIRSGAAWNPIIFPRAETGPAQHFTRDGFTACRHHQGPMSV